MIKFTKEHLAQLKELVVKALFNKSIIRTGLGQEKNIFDLLHCTDIGTLNSILSALKKRINTLEEKDEWSQTEATQKQLEEARENKTLVNLIIGYKRYLQEQAAALNKREKLEEQLESLIEAQKTPEDRIKELKAQIEALPEGDL